jgi:hypothetical protein
MMDSEGLHVGPRNGVSLHSGTLSMKNGTTFMVSYDALRLHVQKCDSQIVANLGICQQLFGYGGGLGSQLYSLHQRNSFFTHFCFLRQQ